jgi:hypothetical protein
MLYEDPVTGALHEIPDSQVGWGLAEDPYGMGEVVYDGLGNPVGFSFRKAFGSLVKKAMPFATSMLGPYGQIINRALPIVRQALGPTAQALRQQAIQQLSGYGEVAPAAVPVPVAPVAVAPIAVAPPPVAAAAPMAGRRPARWVRPPVPYTGLRGRRLYLRCAAWPGPRGLVPAFAAQGTPTPVQPGAPTVVAPPPAIAARPAYGRGRYRRR